jgi:tetratricopeptide (TPR) repeat protein
MARAALSGFWQRVGERPRLDGLDERETAEVLLRVGCLTGWIGSARQIEGAQELALDLLSECADAFARRGDSEKYAEAQNGIALAYWRMAAFDEARIRLRTLLDGKPGASGEQTLSAILILSMVERSEGNPDEALGIHEKAAPLFQGDGVSAHFKGVFHHGYGLSHRKAGNTDEALIEYAAAAGFFEEAGETKWLAAIENNIGFLLYTLQSYNQALPHLLRAREHYVGIGDRRGASQVSETISRVFVEVGDYEEAEHAARSAVLTLREGDEKALLIEALTSHGTALARLGRRREAHAAFGEAEQEALNYVGRKEAGAVVKRMIEELIAPLCLDAGLPLEDPVNLLEKRIIKSALVASDRSMKEVALRLGVEYDTLRYIINERHPELRGDRSPVTPRRRGLSKRNRSRIKKISDGRKKG